MNNTFVILLCAAALLSTINAQNNGQTIYEAGARTGTDRLLTRTNINEKFRLLQTVTRSYTFTAAAGTTITYIRITSPKGRNAGTVDLTSGGLGQAMAGFTFTSRRSFGIKATVEIYGTP